MRTFAPPRGHATAARLVMAGGKRLTFRSAETGELCRGVFTGHAPKATSDHGQVRIEYPRFGFAWPGTPKHRAEIELNSALPWTLHFLRGLGDSVIDLSGLDLADLSVTGGASNVRLILPPPRGDVRVHFKNGVSRVALLRPADIPTTLGIDGGASRLTFDGERYGAIGGSTRLTSSNPAATRDCYTIDVVGGARDLTIVGLDA